jgi:hypothetical protein
VVDADEDLRVMAPSPQDMKEVLAQGQASLGNPTREDDRIAT